MKVLILDMTRAFINFLLRLSSFTLLYLLKSGLLVKMGDENRVNYPYWSKWVMVTI